MQALIAPIASGIVGAIISAFGVYVAITNRLTRIETLIDQLRQDVEKHNTIVERTYKLEAAYRMVPMRPAFCQAARKMALVR